MFGMFTHSTIWTGGMSKADSSSRCGWASANLLSHWTEQKGRGRVNLLSGWIIGCDINLLLPLVYLVLRPSDLDWNLTNGSLHHQLSWVSRLQMADLGTSQLPESHEPIHYNESLSLLLSQWRYNRKIDRSYFLFPWKTLIWGTNLKPFNEYLVYALKTIEA